MHLFIFVFVVTVAAGFLILRSQPFHERYSRDVPLFATHKIHQRAVPRVGGIALFAGCGLGLIAAAVSGHLAVATAAAWLATLAPVLIAGLAEDLTKSVSARTRLLASLLSGALACWLLGVSAERVDIPGIDALLSLPPFAVAFAVVAIAGVAHAVNIVDGLHGLALTLCLLAFAAFGYVGFQVNDAFIVLMAGLGAAATAGLRVWNFPTARMFCGDGGAYLLGAYLAILAGLLVARNDDVSPWFPVLTLFYPLWETTFSACRRRLRQGVPASAPDKLHLHSLLYAQTVQDGAVVHPPARDRANADASHCVSHLALLGVLPAVAWWNRTGYLVGCAVVLVIAYGVVYRRLAAGATPADPEEGRIRAWSSGA